MNEKSGMRDVVAKMRKEMETAIESASGGLNDSTLWWDNYYSQIFGKRLIENLLDDLEQIVAKYAKDLT